jgi:hypothetical protein
MSNRRIPPSSLPAAERKARSRLHQLLSEAEGFLHGSLTILKRRCGKATCRCASDDNARHRSLCLGQTRGGKTTMIHIPRDMEARVREWVANHQQAADLLQELSQQGRERLAHTKAPKSHGKTASASTGRTRKASKTPRAPS